MVENSLTACCPIIGKQPGLLFAHPASCLYICVQGLFEEACAAYTRSIAAHPTAAAHSNRGFMMLKVRLY